MWRKKRNIAERWKPDGVYWKNGVSESLTIGSEAIGDSTFLTTAAADGKKAGDEPVSPKPVVRR